MKRFIVLSLTAALAMAAPVAADTITPQAAIARLFTSDKIDSDWFAPSVLQQVPVAQVQIVIDQLKAQLGAYQEVRPDGDHFDTVFATGYAPTFIALDGQGRILSLFFKPPLPTTKDLSGALDQMRTLPGKISVFIENGSTPVQGIAADQPLAIGSAFKLAEVAAVKKQIDAHRVSWTQIVTLRNQWKSLPSGVLQSWPDGAPLTLYSVAALAVSQSDNTGADLLLRTVGRSAVEAESPSNTPFLTTREAFVLKDPANSALLAKWRAANASARNALLAQLDSKPLPSADIFGGKVTAQDVEWFFSTRQLCALMSRVASLPFMSINPGIADPSQWSRVAYKGGSEPGVLNLTTQVVAKNGKTYCLSATWNDTKPLDEKRFELLYGLLLNSLE
ncbi:MAG: serine hydrolase [Candidatus Eremiobacteraeota bacterium]|nr:serine hydrolase [Candidatus Eremiobacteraeota bacterium]MBV8365020.1 serine hydrolase [Candidatus Eremiobacteraeota bacterium]